jgi:ankyrin repeat protein
MGSNNSNSITNELEKLNDTIAKLDFKYGSINGEIDTVNKSLQDPRVDPSMDNNYAILYASQNGHIKVVDRLLQDPRVDPSVIGNKALRTAAINGRVEVVNRLLQDPRVDPSDALQLALDNCNVEVVNILLKHSRMDPDEYENLINIAIRNNRFNNVWILRKHIKDIILYRKKIIDASDIPEDLIYEISKYMHEDEDYYRNYRNKY